ncbi:hypothetical protein QCD60_02735 [Pokkaliibacter sp. MBI-7]|uniref:hypothetical protein n=1 Tax=Pokkaliibacter sp. MBI-7 TaxID=3040600 RepID=UPI002448F95E|nr:hypothetical protein [Pokkaliibacter sp. MBI-7]MDH2431474.1 hypothetical protein [Pokkaliibacter sp. MBI-7]
MSKFGSLQEQLERMKKAGKGGTSEKRSGLKTFVPVYAPAKSPKSDDDEAGGDTMEDLSGVLPADADYEGDGLDGSGEDFGDEEEAEHEEY